MVRTRHGPPPLQLDARASVRSPRTRLERTWRSHSGTPPPHALLRNDGWRDGCCQAPRCDRQISGAGWRDQNIRKIACAIGDICDPRGEIVLLQLCMRLQEVVTRARAAVERDVLDELRLDGHRDAPMSFPAAECGAGFA
jgi:hypothetical protein